MISIGIIFDISEQICLVLDLNKYEMQGDLISFSQSLRLEIRRKYSKKKVLERQSGFVFRNYRQLLFFQYMFTKRANDPIYDKEK